MLGAAVCLRFCRLAALGEQRSGEQLCAWFLIDAVSQALYRPRAAAQAGLLASVLQALALRSRPAQSRVEGPLSGARTAPASAT